MRKTASKPAEASQDNKGFPHTGYKGAQLHLHLDFGVVAARTVR